MVTWVLERDVFHDGHDQLASAAIKAGGTVVAWQDEWWDDRGWSRLRGDLVFHGSLGNADRISRELPWSPGAYCTTRRFRCSAWWPQATAYLLTPRHVFTSVAELVGHGAPEEFGPRVFIRPDSPLKPFAGRVLDRDRITLEALDHGFYYDDPDLPVVVAPAVTVLEEWRLVVVDGAVVAGSGYTADGRRAAGPLSVDHRAWRFAARLAAEIDEPDPVFVMDVCESDGGLRLLELNPFSGADLYACDRHAVVDAVAGRFS